MKRVNATLISVLLGLGIGASSAFAQAPVEPPKGDRAQKVHERLKAADKNADGKISRTEAAALPRMAKHFDAIDSNKDGLVSREELKAHREKRAAHKSKQS